MDVKTFWTLVAQPREHTALLNCVIKMVNVVNFTCALVPKKKKK